MSEFTEISNAVTALKTFYEDEAAYIVSGGVPPVPGALPAALIFVELLTFSATQAEQGSGYAIGAAQEMISTDVAIIRELSMATTRKFEIYENYAGQCEEEASFINQSGAFYAGVLKGNPTSGSQC